MNEVLYSDIVIYLISIIIIVVFYLLYYFFIKEFLNNTFCKINLEELEIPRKGDNILIFIPHPDDEIIGCYAYIKKAKLNGCKIKIVMVTNGDGVGLFDIKSKIRRPLPQHFEWLACDRQKEVINVLTSIGLKEEDIIFLGYPDGHIMSLWRDNWNKSNQLLSRYTQKDCVFYNNSFNLGTPYTGSCFCEDIEKIIGQYNPTHIVYPNQYDRHLDHIAISCFVKYVILKLGIAPVEVTYLIHSGIWPVPIGKFSNCLLMPPKILSNDNLKWYCLNLLNDEIREKEMYLSLYKSQQKNIIMKFFLLSFVRKNELFASSYDTVLNYNIQFKSSNTVEIINNTNTLSTIIKYFNKPMWIFGYCIYVKNNTIYFKIKTRKKPTLSCKYVLDIFFFNKHNKVSRIIISVINGQMEFELLPEDSFNKISNPISLEMKKDIQIGLPMKEIIDCTSIMINISSFNNQKLIDRTVPSVIKIESVK